MHEKLERVIRDVFDGAEKQLRKLVEKQRGEVKTHEEQQPVAIVSSLFKEDGYGFLKSVTDDREIYFHENSVAGNEFERLEVGTGVWYQAELGEKGLQATTVRIINKPGVRSPKVE
jgi:cold shock CspA family protein